MEEATPNHKMPYCLGLPTVPQHSPETGSLGPDKQFIQCTVRRWTSWTLESLERVGCGGALPGWRFDLMPLRGEPEITDGRLSEADAVAFGSESDLPVVGASDGVPLAAALGKSVWRGGPVQWDVPSGVQGYWLVQWRRLILHFGCCCRNTLMSSCFGRVHVRRPSPL